MYKDGRSGGHQNGPVISCDFRPLINSIVIVMHCPRLMGNAMHRASLNPHRDEAASCPCLAPDEEDLFITNLYEKHRDLIRSKSPNHLQHLLSQWDDAYMISE